VARCVEDLRAAGIEAVNFDLIYGLPGQTVDSVRETGRMAAGLAPDRIAVFGYAHMIEALENGTLRRNFQGYTVDPADALLGFGTSAISSMPQGFAQSSRDMAKWATAIDEGRLTIDRGVEYTPEDLMRAEIIEKLMCFLRVRPEEIAARHGFAPETLADAWEKLEPLEADGLCRIEDGEVIVPEDRRLFVRTVASAFDAYYQPQPNRHAKAV